MLDDISSQSSIKLMNYNLLKFPGTDTTTRNPNFRKIISSVNPDIIAVQEITSQAVIDGFRYNLLCNNYSAGTLSDCYWVGNIIFIQLFKINNCA